MHSDSKSTKAVAIKYEHGTAPKVTAKGEDVVAQEMVALALAAGVHIHQDEHLCEFLQQLSIEETIPEALYLVIAELIAFTYVLEGKFPEKWNNMHQKIMEEV
ncbi:EscU/YscU/HrcU family type III secretion system export apparatus switch protein [Shewanella youngdeokensis]|uniref:EscU/YscU/HrcU family type III secretion system export apparatus switch protein n=1 Tax=Shewanella youngdeokensis TaxID=2999068 RepID=A0ABZ0K147_9GAMM|nr:EscU/YscU/HrcU family type III secretion system export apparatus switch protein [Shewanella sp. DAU334]